MNILIVMSVAASGLCLLWIVQSAVLVFVGEPLAWPLRFETRRPLVKWTSRVMIHTTWLIILVGTPFALGTSPLEWLHQEFPTPVPWRDIAVAFSIMLFPVWSMYALWIAAGWVRIEPPHDRATRRGKLFRRFIGPWPLATLEEAVFRGVLLEELLRSFPQSKAYTALAIVVISVVFSSTHFIKRPHSGRRVWQPAYGLFIISCLFGLAYVVGGRSLWLPIAMHGAAVFAIEIMRLYLVYQGPPWLLGYAEFPQSGLLGSLLVLGVAIALVLLI
jgi:Type II CAAX prenyl endopeptidase Rce1-like